MKEKILNVLKHKRGANLNDILLAFPELQAADIISVNDSLSECIQTLVKSNKVEAWLQGKKLSSRQFNKKCYDAFESEDIEKIKALNEIKFYISPESLFNSDTNGSKTNGFWSTIPGILTAISGFIAAIAALIKAVSIFL